MTYLFRALLLLAFCWLWFCLGVLSAGNEFSAIADVKHHDTYDTQNTQFFQLCYREECITVSADNDTEFARYIRQQNRVKVTVVPFSVERLDR